jgi:type I restriction enzyme, S subunit
MSKSMNIVKDLEADGILLVQDGNHGEYRPRPNEFTATGTAFIRAADLGGGGILFGSAQCINEVARARIRKGIGAPGDVLLSHKGTVGKVAFAPGDAPPFVCSPQTTFWRSLNHDVLYPGYLYAYLRSEPFIAQLRARENESDMAAYVSLTEQRKLLVSVPPIAVQKAIAAVLGALDDKIAVNERIATVADELTRCLSAESAHEGRVSIRSIASLVKDQVSPASLDCAEVAHYSLPAFDLGKMPIPTNPQDIKSTKFVVASPAVLLSKLNPEIPRVWNVAPEVGTLGVASTEFLVLEPKEGISTAELWAVLSQPGFLGRLAAKVTGTSKSHQRVLPAEVLSSEVVDPRSLGTARGQVHSLAMRSMSARTESRTLAALRDTLLPQLMSGKLRVRDAERIVEDAV